MQRPKKTTNKQNKTNHNSDTPKPKKKRHTPPHFCERWKRRRKKRSINTLWNSEGHDGSWSTFTLRVGTPKQAVRVLVSTASPETLVVLEEAGCSKQAFKQHEVPSDCPASRGMLFNQSASSTWQDKVIFFLNNGGVGFEANLGYNQAAVFGSETVGLGLVAGSGGPSLENQIVGAVASVSPSGFYLYGDLIYSPVLLLQV